MDENYQALFQRIREKCQRRGWYGSDGNKLYEKQRLAIEADQYHLYATYDLYDEAGNPCTFAKFEPGFVYPPATEEQLAAAEAILGFPLPSLLRALYANVANGDFGPGFGINGAFSIANAYLDAKRMSRLIDIAIYEKRQGAAHLEIPSYVHPDRFLTLCHWGCAIFSHLDCTSDRVFRGGFISRERYRLDLEASSLYEWLDLWSKDELKF